MRTTLTPSTRISASSRVRLTQAGLVICLSLTTAGCQSMGLGSWKKPKLTDPAGTNVEDPWTTQAGREGRAGQAVEKEADPLHLRRFLMSEKAMEIERNCGFE